MKFIYFFVTLIVGCSSIHNDIFITQKLPIAKVGEFYYAEIIMKDQGIIEDMFYIETDLNSDSGLSILSHQKADPNFSHSITVVEGKPNKVGLYNINISGIARDGNKRFNKKYIVNIKE